MRIFARRINRAKWESRDGLAGGEVPADAVTGDLRTAGNRLSFWGCASGQVEDLRDVVLALASNAERLDKCEVAWMDSGAIDSVGLTTSSTDGDTPVRSLRGHHVEIAGLDYVRLGKVADLIVAALASGQHMRMTKREVRDVVKEAIQSELVRLEDLKKPLREEFEAALGMDRRGEP